MRKTYTIFSSIYRLSFVCLGLLVLGTTQAQTGYISTAAGTGVPGYIGDGGPAISAQLNKPSGVAVDAAGDIFIADEVNNVIREVNKATGKISTVAGIGSAGYSGDGGPATSAQLNSPSGVAVDPEGDIFIADGGNNVIREVNATTGEISTVAGTGRAGYRGDGRLATSARLNTPYGVAVDAAGDIFIADEVNNVIREVNKATGNISTVAGTGTYGYSGDGGSATSAQLNYPSGVALDAVGDIFIVEVRNNVIREVNKATGNISTVAGDGKQGYSLGFATSARLDTPYGVAVDAAGNIFIADYGNTRISEVNASTGLLSVVAGNHIAGYSGDGHLATSAQLSYPTGVAVDAAGDIFIADELNNRVREVTTKAQLPVGLTDFSATLAAGNSVGLNWSTASETGNKGFQVQRSTDKGNTWVNLQFVNSQASNGNSSATLNYSYTDDAPITGTNEYRLNQTNVDGHAALSTVVSLNIDTPAALVTIYPNPATGLINIKGLASGTQFRVVNIAGEAIVRGVVTGSVFALDIANLTSGIYFLSYHLNGQEQSVKLIKK